MNETERRYHVGELAHHTYWQGVQFARATAVIWHYRGWRRQPWSRNAVRTRLVARRYHRDRARAAAAALGVEYRY